MTDFKTIFLEKFEEDIRAGKIRSICDLGSGTSSSFISLLETYPELRYVGVEPSAFHADVARRTLARFKNACVYNALAYEAVKDENWGNFDLVISLSVLEHVKQIEKFIGISVEAARSGGQIVHRYDLGHALHPSSPKEHLQVFMGDHMPSLLPEHKFVSGIRPSRITRFLEEGGARIEQVTYHQMPNHKHLLKLVPSLPEDLIRKMVEWEFEVSPHLDTLDEEVRLKLFPAIAFWAHKI